MQIPFNDGDAQQIGFKLVSLHKRHVRCVVCIVEDGHVQMKKWRSLENLHAVSASFCHLPL
jgi:hypothetical protein